MGLSSVAQAQEAQPWVDDRGIGEGAGIRLGDFELHPGVAGEFGYDSNYFLRADTPEELSTFGPPADALRLRVTPQFSLRNLDRRIDLAEDERDTLPPVVGIEVSGAAQYNELIGFGAEAQEVRAQRSVQGGGGFMLNFLPERKWSGHGGANYNYMVMPSNQEGQTPDFQQNFDRHVVGVDAGVQWAPGGGAFEWTLLRYFSRFSFFPVDSFSVYDNNNHSFLTQGRWKFLPKTALLYEGKVGVIRYGRPSLNNGESLEARLGINGLLTKRLSLLVMGGWASSFYSLRPGNVVVRNYDDFVARAEARWYLSPGGAKLQEGSANVGAESVAAGYARSFQDSYLGDFFQRDRGYLQFMYLIGGNIVTTLEGGVSLINYPDFQINGNEQGGFSETRVDATAFVEYRPLQTVGLNLQLRYDEAFSQEIVADTYTDDLSFSRFRAFIGARWFL